MSSLLQYYVEVPSYRISCYNYEHFWRTTLSQWQPSLPTSNPNNSGCNPFSLVSSGRLLLGPDNFFGVPCFDFPHWTETTFWYLHVWIRKRVPPLVFLLWYRDLFNMQYYTNDDLLRDYLASSRSKRHSLLLTDFLAILRFARWILEQWLGRRRYHQP